MGVPPRPGLLPILCPDASEDLEVRSVPAGASLWWRSSCALATCQVWAGITQNMMMARLRETLREKLSLTVTKGPMQGS